MQDGIPLPGYVRSVWLSQNGAAIFIKVPSKNGGKDSIEKYTNDAAGWQSVMQHLRDAHA